MALPERRFSTGLEFLDRRLDGGIPIQSIVALTAPPSSQSELLLYQFTRAQPTVYLSTVTPQEEEVLSLVDKVVQRPKEVTFSYASPSSLLQNPESVLSRIENESYVIVDVANGLEEASREEYLSFLDKLKERVRETDSVAVLYCLTEEENPPQRSLTLKRADHVWQLEQRTLTNTISTRLLVTKSRGYRALTEPIPLLLSDRVLVDTSRNIA